MSNTVYILGIIACLCGSAFFSASEMAFSSCNRKRLENAVDDGSRKAEAAIKVCDRFEDALSAILIGNNLVNIAGSSLASVLVIVLTDNNGLTWIATAGMTVLVIIFGESIPKITAKKNPTGFAMNFAFITRALTIVLYPVIWLVVKLVHIMTIFIRDDVDTDNEDEVVEELQSIIETAEDEEIIDEDSSELVQAAIDFSDISAYEVMTARVDVQAMDVDDEPEDVMSFIYSANHSRIPVYEDSIDNIIGVLSVNRFLKAVADGEQVNDIRSMLMPACYVYKTMKLPQVLDSLKAAKQHLAVVSDEYGGTLGVISMEDVLEQIVGEIWDETDEVEPEIISSSEGKYEIDGDMPISDFIELVGLDENSFEAESETVGGWTMEMLESFPKEGDSFDYEGLRITVSEVDGRRVVKVIAEAIENKEE